MTEGEARLAEGWVKPPLRLRMHAKGESEPHCNWRKEHSRKVERYPGGQMVVLGRWQLSGWETCLCLWLLDHLLSC